MEMENNQLVVDLKKADVDALVKFSIAMGKLSEEGKFEMMEKIMTFIKTGDKSLLPQQKSH